MGNETMSAPLRAVVHATSSCRGAVESGTALFTTCTNKPDSTGSLLIREETPPERKPCRS